MVKPGYKQTEIGVIPEEWGISTLGAVSVGNLTYGINAPAKKYMPPLPNYIRITDITEDGHFNKENRASVDCINPDKYLLHEGDVVLARTGASVGKSYLYDTNDGLLVYAGFLIRASIDANLANSYYVVSSLRTKRYWDWVGLTSMRSGQPGINGKEYASYPLMIPSLVEQNKIAEALQDVDKQIDILEKLIAKKKAIKQGTMQELLTGKKRLPGFNGGWRQLRIGDFGELIKTSINPQLSPTTVYTEYSMPAFDAGQIPHQVAGRDMHSNRILISDGVLLFNKLNVRQKRVWLIEKCNNSAVCSAEFLPFYSDSVDLKLLKQLLLTDKITEDFINMSTGTSNSQRRINPDDFLSYMVFMPVDIEEQHAIAEIFSNIDSEIEWLEQKLAKARQLKQGMMQQLLTGRIRLV